MVVKVNQPTVSQVRKDAQDSILDSTANVGWADGQLDAALAILNSMKATHQKAKDHNKTAWHTLEGLTGLK